jgi:hypothetical protein
MAARSDEVASLDKPGYLSDGDGFVVLLDAGNTVVTCTLIPREPGGLRGRSIARVAA